MMNKVNKQQAGFTLVEMMVSVAIFTIIMTIGIGALVSMLDKYKYSQETKQVSDSLNFVLEGMTREIRLGYNYCIEGSSPQEGGCDGSVEMTSNGTKDLISFEASDNRGYMVYGIKNGALYRKVYPIEGDTYGEAVTEMLTDIQSIHVTKARFQVLYAEDSEDQRQPLVWFQIVASPKSSEQEKEYTIQSLVSQRVLDA